MIDNKVSFFVEGNPLPKQSAEFGNKRAWTPQRIKNWQDMVSVRAREAMRGYGPFEFLIKAKLVFLRETHHNADGGNLEKPVLDGMNGICYIDDKQVKEMHRWTSYNKHKPGVMITLEECTWTHEDINAESE